MSKPSAPSWHSWLPPCGSALRASWREGYGWQAFRRDAMAGVVVGVVALPLSMALAIAVGAPPQHGLYTAIVAGVVTALFGGSRVQVSGPTAAFVVILAPITAQYGLSGLMLATVLAGILLMAMGWCRFGSLIRFVPYPVTTGFTSGIAVVIAVLQLRDLFGLRMQALPDHFHDKVRALLDALPGWQPVDFGIGLLTLALLIGWHRSRWGRRIPSPVVALVLVSAAALGLSHAGYDAVTVGDRFSFVQADGSAGRGVPSRPPVFAWPWAHGGSEGTGPAPDFSTVRALAPSALAIAMLGAIESLLSAVVADGMTGEKHDPDAELFAQGLGNLVAPFFGGIAATGAVARTATNVQSGGRSPLASVTHAAFVLAAVLLLAPWLAYLPMASLAALLLRVAWNMSESKHFLRVLRVGPGSDRLVLVTCFGLTVFFDMVVAVGVGVVLAALLFMKRMADISESRLLGEEHHRPLNLPDTVAVYEIAGPLFFGAAQKAMSAIRSTQHRAAVVLLDMRAVPVMDVTGLVNLGSALDRLERIGVRVVIAGVRDQPLKVLARGLRRNRRHVAVLGDFEEGVDTARRWATEADLLREPIETATVAHRAT